MRGRRRVRLVLTSCQALQARQGILGFHLEVGSHQTLHVDSGAIAEFLPEFLQEQHASRFGMRKHSFPADTSLFEQRS
jgi:hypothetical protein